MYLREDVVEGAHLGPHKGDVGQAGGQDVAVEEEACG